MEAEWDNLPGSGHYCLIARWVSAADPMTHPETADVNANTRKNNNIIWRNLNIVNLVGDRPVEVSLEIRNPEPRESNYSLVLRGPRGVQGEGSFLAQGRVLVELDQALFRSWQRGGRRGEGFRALGCRRFELSRTGRVSFEGLILGPGQLSTVTLRFDQPRPLAPGSYFLDLVQREGVSGEELGGVGYEIRVAPRALPDPPPTAKRSQRGQLADGG